MQTSSNDCAKSSSLTGRRVAVVGGGLAGCEAAWQLAGLGAAVDLYEMRPEQTTPAHTSGALAELVCSNSFRSDDPQTAVGLLKREMAEAGGLIMDVARRTSLPAGSALAVDRERFAEAVTEAIVNHPNITLHRREIERLDDPALTEAEGVEAAVIAAGPLASDALAADIARVTGSHEGEGLYFYDAIAPVVDTLSVDTTVAFWGARHDPDDHSYLNCPLTEDEYKAFVAALTTARTVPYREFEQGVHFEGCLPIEEMAERGEMTLAFGPLKPVGIIDPRTGTRPFAVVQLRPENHAKTALNLVGFQTKLTYPEQKRIFRTLPGLAEAEFLRLGSIHRNTYVDAPRLFAPDGSLAAAPHCFLAGQITGVEGYLESNASGLWAALQVAARLSNADLPAPPHVCALGALAAHLRGEGVEHANKKRYTPSNVNFGLMPPLEQKMGKKRRKLAYAERARTTFAAWLAQARPLLPFAPGSC